MSTLLTEYQMFVKSCPLYDDVVYGLIGELSEVIEPYKKSKREGARRKAYNRDEMLLELGDVFWYLTRFCIQEGYKVEDILNANIIKLTNRHSKEGN